MGRHEGRPILKHDEPYLVQHLWGEGNPYNIYEEESNPCVFIIRVT